MHRFICAALALAVSTSALAGDAISLPARSSPVEMSITLAPGETTTLMVTAGEGTPWLNIRAEDDLTVQDLGENVDTNMMGILCRGPSYMVMESDEGPAAREFNVVIHNDSGRELPVLIKGGVTMEAYAAFINTPPACSTEQILAGN